MPDPSAFDRGAMLVRLVNSSRMGGIVEPSSRYKLFSVEIRPPKWSQRIWIGKLETRELAKCAADAVYHYLGMPSFHHEKGVMTLPAITCIGTVNGTPVELSTQQAFANHVSAIAKGEAFKPQRDDFKEQVRNVVKNPAFPFLSSPRTEVVVLDDHDDSDREDEVEYDDDAAKALLMSSYSGSGDAPVPVLQKHAAGPDSGGGAEAVQAYVASFVIDSNDSEKSLRSEEQSFSAIVFSLDDCQPEDAKPWRELIEELDNSTAAGTCTPSVVSDDRGDGYETSPIFDMAPIERPWATSKKIGTPVERAVTVGTGLGSSSDCPSSQFAMNAKRRRITRRS